MKILWGVMICLLLFLILAYMGQNYLQTSAEDIHESMRPLEDHLRKSEWEKAEIRLGQVEQKWHKVRGKWGLMVDHWEIDAIEIALVRLAQFIRCKSKADALAEFATLKDGFGHIPKKERLSWESIL